MTRYTADEMAKWTGGKWDMAPAGPLAGVSKDSRSVQRGEIYFALQGEQFDGHAFVADALARGAAGAVVRNGWQAGRDMAGAPLLRVKDPLAALQEAGRCYRRKAGARIIAVTGSAGKSTVKEMISQVLARTAPTAKTQGNYNNNIGLPVSLLSMPADSRFGVFEIGSNHPGEIRALCCLLEPEWGVVTNIGPVHIEFFGSLEAIVGEKRELLCCLPGEGRAFLNSDDQWYGQLREGVRARVVTVGSGAKPDYKLVCARPDAGVFEVQEVSGVKEQLELRVPGSHNLANALLAVAVARQLEIPWSEIREGLRGFVPLPMRWQEERLGRIWLVNDAYNANPMSMRAAIKTFADRKWNGSKWLVLGGMRELGDVSDREHREIGRYAAGYEWGGLVVVGTEAGLMAEGARSGGMPADRIHACATVEEAAAALVDGIRGDGAVFFKASRGERLERAIDIFRRRISEAA